MNEETFLNAFAEILEIAPEAINMDTELAALDAWDSVNILTYIAFVDEKYSREIVPDQIEQAKTVADLYRIANGEALG